MLFTIDEIRARLYSECEYLGGQTEWAERYNVPQNRVSDFLNRNRGLNPAMLVAMGLRKVVYYEEISASAALSLASTRADQPVPKVPKVVSDL